MVFSLEEKKACIFILIAIADCDGKRNRDEMRELSNCSRILRIGLDEYWNNILFELSTMTQNEIVSIVKPMDIEKKAILESCMKNVIEADGIANETELLYWWDMSEIFELPSLELRKHFKHDE